MIRFVKAREQPPKRRFVDVSSNDEFWQSVHMIADRKYPLFRRLVLDAWGNWRNDIDVEALFGSLLAANVDQATFIVQRPWVVAANDALPKVQSLMADTVAEAAQRTLPRIEAQIADATGPGISIRFGGPASREVQNWARDQAGRLITRIGETERAAIRELILDGVRSSRTPTQVAQDIRQFIGVTHPQAKTLMRLREAMQAANIPPSRIQQRIEARTRKMIRQRASMIARNEGLMASKAGERMAYMQSIEQGHVDPNTARRFWMVSPDERLCPRCAPIPSMNPDGVKLDEPYATPIGPLTTAHAHIICRCTERLEL